MISLSADFMVSTNRTHVQKTRGSSVQAEPSRAESEGVALNIASPRPVASPFLFRGILEVTSARPGGGTNTTEPRHGYGVMSR